MVAINSAIEVDLTGQVVADSIGQRLYSGVGGQMDFIRGAALAGQGRAIIALPSTAAGGTVSRIVPILRPGAGVVTTRAHVRTVVTEWGVAELFGKSLRERAAALICHRASGLPGPTRTRGTGRQPRLAGERSDRVRDRAGERRRAGGREAGARGRPSHPGRRAP